MQLESLGAKKIFVFFFFLSLSLQLYATRETEMTQVWQQWIPLRGGWICWPWDGALSVECDEKRLRRDFVHSVLAAVDFQTA